MEPLRPADHLSHWVTRIGDRIEKTTGILCVLLFVHMTFTALLGVFFRYVMNNPFQWTEEVARYTLIWLGFLAINIALWRGQHIRIPFFLKIMPPAFSKWTSLLTDVLIMLYLAIVLRFGWSMTWDTSMTGQSLNISMFWFYLAVPVSAALTLVQTALTMIRKILMPAESFQREL